MKELKILLVDDEEDFVHTFAERLRIRNINPTVATSGERALEIIKEDTPDVIVSDLKMPGIDGLDVLRGAKKICPDAQVIILTGHGSIKEEKNALRSGAFHYLQKPVDINELVQVISRAYREKAV